MVTGSATRSEGRHRDHFVELWTVSTVSMVFTFPRFGIGPQLAAERTISTRTKPDQIKHCIGAAQTRPFSSGWHWEQMKLLVLPVLIFSMGVLQTGQG